MSVNLNEFTSEQLQWAINTMKVAQDDANRKISILEDFDDCDTKTAGLELFNVDLDNAILWRVQLENAIQEVRERDRIYNQ